MSDHYWRTKTQSGRVKRYCPRSHGRPRVIDGKIHVIRNGLRWRDAPEVYGPHKTLYNRFFRWSRMGVFDRILSGLAACGSEPDIVMIDATHLKVHRTACRLAKKGLFRAVLAERKAALTRTSCIVRQKWKTAGPVLERRPAIGSCWSKADLSGDADCQSALAAAFARAGFSDIGSRCEPLPLYRDPS